MRHFNWMRWKIPATAVCWFHVKFYLTLPPPIFALYTTCNRKLNQISMQNYERSMTRFDSQFRWTKSKGWVETSWGDAKNGKKWIYKIAWLLHERNKSECMWICTFVQLQRPRTEQMPQFFCGAFLRRWKSNKWHIRHEYRTEDA